MTRRRMMVCVALLVMAAHGRADATPIKVSGWDTCDESGFTSLGGTSISTIKRTGRCALHVTATSGVAMRL